MKHNIKKSWDMAFSAPKSVSVLMAVGDQKMSDAILQAQKNAVRSAMHFISKKAVLSKRNTL